MNATFRLFLSLLICLVLPMHVGAVPLADGACYSAKVSVVKTMPMASSTTADCQSAGDKQAPPMGTLCKAGAVCGFTVSAPLPTSGFFIGQDQGTNYTPASTHFILQNFPRMLLRPPILG
jgi:hypothetical protein